MQKDVLEKDLVGLSTVTELQDILEAQLRETVMLVTKFHSQLQDLDPPLRTRAEIESPPDHSTSLTGLLCTYAVARSHKADGQIWCILPAAMASPPGRQPTGRRPIVGAIKSQGKLWALSRGEVNNCLGVIVIDCTLYLGVSRILGISIVICEREKGRLYLLV